jgi:hypothetical protein
LDAIQQRVALIQKALAASKPRKAARVDPKKSVERSSASAVRRPKKWDE